VDYVLANCLALRYGVLSALVLGSGVVFITAQPEHRLPYDLAFWNIVSNYNLEQISKRRTYAAKWGQ
jgi:hypothetical protein